MRSTVGLLILLCLAPAALHAQVAWDGPSLVSPHSPTGLSLLLVSADPGGSLGAMAHWGGKKGSLLTLGYRGGVVQNDAEGTSAFGGVDISGSLASSVEEADVQVAWWSGIGAGVGDELVVSIPAGLVVSWRGLGDGNVFAPYAGGHVSLDMATGAADGVSLDASLDLGIDLTLTSGWIVRFGASVWGRQSLGVGIRMPS